MRTTSFDLSKNNTSGQDSKRSSQASVDGDFTKNNAPAPVIDSESKSAAEGVFISKSQENKQTSYCLEVECEDDAFDGPELDQKQ